MDFARVHGFVIHFLVIVLVVLQNTKQKNQLVGTILNAQSQASIPWNSPKIPAFPFDSFNKLALLAIGTY